MRLSAKTTANISLLLISTIAGLGISEYLTRAIAPQFRHGQWLPSQVLEGHSLRIRPPKTTFRQRSNSGEFDVQYSINQLGFRDRHPRRGDPSNTIIFVGDSFTEGYGVKQSKRYPEYARNPQREVVVSALGGYNIKDYIKVLSYLKENDILNYDQIPKKTPSSPKTKNKITRLKNWLNMNSSLFNMLATLARSNSILNDAAISLGLAAKQNEFSKAEFNQKEIRSSARLLSSSLLHGKNVVILIIPDRRVWAGQDHDSKQAIARQQLLQDELIKRGLSVIDMTNKFTNSSKNPLSEYHFLIDGHWNEKGHKIAGEMIKNELLARPSKHSAENN